jgi:uncharacterized protein YndB with AHSA1/START domain
MRCEVHAFEPRVGGRFRISLTYEDAAFAGRGKSGGATDTFSGRFVELVPDQRVVETVEFESGDAALRGGQRLIITLTDARDTAPGRPGLRRVSGFDVPAKRA